MTIQLKTNPTDKVIELGGGSHPLVRPNVDVRICHDEQGNRTVDFTADFHEPLPIQSDEWDGVFSQFAIEHIAYPKVLQFIAEVFRILKPGGKAVIVTANTEAQLRWALDHPEGWDGKDLFESASCKLFGDQRHGEREGDKNYGHDSHKVFFSPVILTKLFQDAGFVGLRLTPYGARDTDIVVEAVKPGELTLARKTLYGSGGIEKALGHLASLPENQDEAVNEAIKKVIHDDLAASFSPENWPMATPKQEQLAEEAAKNLPWLSPDVGGSGLPQPEPVNLEAKQSEVKIRVHPDSPWGKPSASPSLQEIEELKRLQVSRKLEREIMGDVAQDAAKSTAKSAAAPAQAKMSVSTPAVTLSSYQPEKLFNREYFNGGAYKPFYWDFPAHELTARHVLSRKPESVLELGCGRGYILKRLQDAGIRALGLEVSRHCHLTRVAERVHPWDITKTPWDTLGNGCHDLCFSIAVLDHIPEEFLPAIFAELERTCNRGLHGINFGPAGDDKTRVTIHPKEWWQLRLPRGHEVVDKNELEGGPFPEDVFRGDGKCKLNIGCAQTMFHHGWDNIDIHNLQQWAQGHGYRYQPIDVRQGIPWGTGGVDLIYCGHMLEHLSYKEGLTFLRECRRVIKPDGAMRIIVPDGKLLTGLYADDGDRGESKPAGYPWLEDFDEVNEGCALAPTAAGKLWSLLMEGHQAIYDKETLMNFVTGAGFNAHRTEFRTVNGSRHEATKQILRETLDTHPALSLYVDAVPRVG